MKPRFTRPLVLTLAVLILVFSLLLTACNQSIASVQSQTSGSPSASPSKLPSSNELPSSGSPSGVGQTTSSTIPKYGGTLRNILSVGPPNIGWPAEITSGAADLQYCLETLLHSDNKGNIVPWLAESYKIADDMKSITFKLRKGIKFHDGSDFNAGVAKWNMDNMINAHKQPNWVAVDVTDDYTIRLNLKEWSNTLLFSFAESEPATLFISKAAYDKNGKTWMKTNPVGTGPFKLESFQQDVSLKIVKNPDYWRKNADGNQLPYLDGIECLIIVNPTTREMTMKTGGADMANIDLGKSAADYAAMGLKIITSMDANLILVPDSAHTDSIWSNQKIREAVEYAIDREGISKAFGHGFTQAAYQIPARSSTAFDPDFPLGRKYDPEKAKQLLAEAGYPNGFKSTIIADPFANRDIVTTLQAQLAIVGIQVELEFPEAGKWVSHLGPAGTWQNAAILMPCPSQGPSFIGGLQFSYSFWGNNWLKTPELKQAYQAAFNSPAVDVELIRKVTDMATRDALFIPVSEIGSATAIRTYVVANFGERSTPTFWNIEEAWLNK
jgi:peptide/nickel transport system substrate-binding protein